jgi:hypothetical protein
MFSIFVKCQIFTKHISSQWTPSVFFLPSEVCCSATIIERRSAERGGMGEKHTLFSQFEYAASANSLEGHEGCYR